jgi:ABC-type lipoprotein release transport system permease subunit
MAWRNVWRNRRRTWVTIAAMSFGLFVMILYSGLMDGYLEGVERSILDLEVGDVQVFADHFREDPALDSLIEDPDAVIEPLVESGFAASPRLLAFGLAAAGESSAGVSFRGIDVDRDARVSRIDEVVAEGSWLDPGDPKGVVLGRRLARVLGVGVGDEIVVLTQGIADATDRSGVFLNADTLRELVGVPTGVHQIVVRRPEGVALAPAAARVSRVAPGLDVQTWRQLLPTLSSLLDSTRGIMIAMFFLIYVAIGLLILNAMLMAVFERIRELGVLKALGVGPFEVLRLILIESGIQVAISVLLGVVCAIPAVAYLATTGIDLGALAGTSVMGIAMEPVWRAAVGPATFTTPIVVLLGIVGLAVLYPAVKAAAVQPVEAMRHL